MTKKKFPISIQEECKRIGCLLQLPMLYWGNPNSPFSVGYEQCPVHQSDSLQQNYRLQEHYSPETKVLNLLLATMRLEIFSHLDRLWMIPFHLHQDLVHTIDY
jgi:hypothetical protein